MIQVKHLTQTTKQNMIRHGFSQAQQLQDIYKTFHKSKYAIINRAYEVYNLMRGYDFRIIGKNSQTFSAGFYYKDNDNLFHFVYITRDEVYDCFVGGKENLIACGTINLIKEKNHKIYTLDDFTNVKIEESEHEQEVGRE